MRTQTTEFLDDVMITACEGGINYWADVLVYRPSEGRVEIGADGRCYNLNRKVIQDGIRRICDPDRRFNVRADIVRMVAGSQATGDASDIDAECADCVVQAALFNKIVYG